MAFFIFLTLLCGNMCFWVYVFKTISHNHSPAHIEISKYKPFFYMCSDMHFLIFSLMHKASEHTLLDLCVLHMQDIQLQQLNKRLLELELHRRK